MEEVAKAKQRQRRTHQQRQDREVAQQLTPEDLLSPQGRGEQQIQGPAGPLRADCLRGEAGGDQRDHGSEGHRQPEEDVARDLRRLQRVPELAGRGDERREPAHGQGHGGEEDELRRLSPSEPGPQLPRPDRVGEAAPTGPRVGRGVLSVGESPTRKRVPGGARISLRVRPQQPVSALRPAKQKQRADGVQQERQHRRRFGQDREVQPFDDPEPPPAPIGEADQRWRGCQQPHRQQQPSRMLFPVPAPTMLDRLDPQPQPQDEQE